MRSPANPEETIALYHAVYVAAWLVVTPNSSRMTGLLAVVWEVA